MPITARDPELKRQRGYTDPKSYVRADGSEVLFRADWKRRVEELAARSGGRCEFLQEMTEDGEQEALYRCTMAARDPHHIKKRWPRRDDRIENLEHLCGPHHDQKDPRKVRWSAKRRNV